MNVNIYLRKTEKMIEIKEPNSSVYSQFNLDTKKFVSSTPVPAFNYLEELSVEEYSTILNVLDKDQELRKAEQFRLK